MDTNSQNHFTPGEQPACLCLGYHHDIVGWELKWGEEPQKDWAGSAPAVLAASTPSAGIWEPPGQGPINISLNKRQSSSSVLQVAF